MAGSIVSAQVGGSAGGNVIPNPQDASYATWPAFASKTLDDITAIYTANLEAKNASNPGTIGKADAQPSAPNAPSVYSAIFSRDTFILGAIIIVAIVSVRFFAR